MALRNKTRRTLLLGFIASVSVCGLFGIYCLIVGQIGPFEEKVLATSGIVSACAILGLAAAVPWERRRWHPVGPMTAIAICAALLLSLLAVWVVPNFDAAFGRALLVTWIIAVSLCHIGLLSLARLRARWASVQIGTAICAAVLSAQLVTMILWEIDEEVLFRIAGILAILASCGTVSVPILHRVSGLRQREGVTTVVLELALTCPRCGKTQTLPVGPSRCGQCGLKFAIEIDEDTCHTCGYPLYQLQSAVCPECGTPITRSTQTEPPQSRGG